MRRQLRWLCLMQSRTTQNELGLSEGAAGQEMRSEEDSRLRLL